ncbi:4-hydroxythreonine-4-phosphate dehydrogenase [Faecalicatena contorta]|nr:MULTISPECIES: hypothetical protein [Clostridia]GKH30799.1 4-hydroxythreonine-4-phosphate dehydrogenase [Faecalicatena contorta]
MSMLDKIIIMLTHNDKTVPNAIELFEENSDLPIQYWGFKDVGMERDKMKLLCTKMRDAGKTSFLEVVSYTEEECMRGAEIAVDCGFDYLLGTLYYDSVAHYIKEHNLKYCPFAGKVSGSPSILEGTLEEMLAQEADFADKGVFGTDILGYRYIDGDPNVLSAEYIKYAKRPVVLAGSIGSVERIMLVKEMNPWTFTMGSALFTENFVNGGSFRENLMFIVDLLKTL